MGRTAAGHLALLEVISELVVADLDEGAASATVASLDQAAGSVSAATVDVLDGGSLRRLLERADLVVNCSGPFFRLGEPVLRAAIETTTDHVDICDDPDPTAAMLELDAAAHAAGVVAVVGMGASPGLSNLLAVRAARQLDTVADCYTAWPLDVTGPDGEPFIDEEIATQSDAPSAAAIHLMEQIHGEVMVVEDGNRVRKPPLEAVELAYPEHPPGTAYTVGHPEPLTLGTSLGVTGRCANLMVLSAGSTVAYLRGLQRELDRGRLTLDQAARALLQPTPVRKAKAIAGGMILGGPGGLPPFFALVRGQRGGEAITAGCHLTAIPPGMDGATSIPAALAVAQLLDARPEPGVHPPEHVIDPDRLLTDLTSHCHPHVDSLDALAPVVLAT
jgi:hypothetical protein